MNAPSRTALLSLALRVFGLVFMFGIVIRNRIWPADGLAARAARTACRLGSDLKPQVKRFLAPLGMTRFAAKGSG
jgi:hypothetical protein